jgi:hypothetical protein
VRSARQLLVLLLCLGLLVIAQIASADGEVEAASAAREPTIELSEEGEWEEECVEGGEEEDEEESSEATEAEEESCEEAGDSEAGPLDGCPLRSARAHAATSHDKLKVTLGYTTDEPVAARIQIRIGSTRVGSFERHLGRSGVLRFSEKVDKTHGRRVTVQIDPAGGAGCPSRLLALASR